MADGALLTTVSLPVRCPYRRDLGRDGRVRRCPRRCRTCRAVRRRRRSPGAGRRAQSPEADRQRELRQSGGVAGDGQLAERQVRGGQSRSPALRGLRQRRHHRSAGRRVGMRAVRRRSRLRPAAQRDRRQPGGLLGGAVPTGGVTGARQRLGVRHVNDLSAEEWETSASGARQPDAARHVARGRRPPHSRLPTQHLGQALPPPLLRCRSRDLAPRLRRGPTPGPRRATADSASPATAPIPG